MRELLETAGTVEAFVTGREEGRLPKELLHLHVFRPVAAKVIQLSEETPDAVSMFEALVASDQGLAAEMLHQANSALFGQTAQVDSIRQAVVLLGLQRVKALALRASMEVFMDKALRLPVVRQCWLHSLACAELASKLAALVKVSKDRAYVAGLLHDVGRLGLLRCYPAKFVPLMTAQYDDPSAVLAAEQSAFLLDHCAVGSSLMEHWDFPPELCAVAEHHHDPPETERAGLLCVIQVACRLADCLGFDAVRLAPREQYDAVVARLPWHLRRKFKFTIHELEEQVVDKVQFLDR
jgi:putative nucleotidyltransferase with HDIG domain